MGKLAAFLREKGHRVCSEELSRTRRQRPTQFRLSSQPRKLHEILDDVIACNPNYRWDFVTNSEIVNVVPNNSRLSVPLQLPADQGRRLIHCAGELYGPCQLHYSDFLLGNFNDPGRIENWPFNVRGGNVLARDYLNQLAAQYDGMSWYVTSGTAVYFEVCPQEEFDAVAERLRSEARQRDEYLRKAADADGQFLRAVVRDLPPGNGSVPDWADRLRKLGHRICCESVHEPEYHVRPLRFVLSTTSRPLAEMLDELTAHDPRYQWNWVHGQELINVVPVDSRLDVRLQEVRFSKERLKDCTNRLFDKCRIGYGGPGMSRLSADAGCIGNWPFDMTATEITCRDYLNLLAMQYDGLTWHISNTGTAVFHVHPWENYETVAERLRAEARQRRVDDEQALKRELDLLDPPAND